MGPVSYGACVWWHDAGRDGWAPAFRDREVGYGMASAVDGLKKRIMALGRPDADGVYRDGAGKRRERCDLATAAISRLWADACDSVSFGVPQEGIALAAVGSLARGQMGPSSDLDLVVIMEPRVLKDAQISELTNKLWYPLWDCGLDLDHSVRTRQQCESVTDQDLPAAMGWLDVLPVAGDSGLVERTSSSILERWRRAARKRLPELLESASSRLEEFGRMPYLNQPNVKEARGGLRDAVLVSALAASWLADRPHGGYDDAVEKLLDVRDCIHLVAGKDTDLLLAQYQPSVARMMGLCDPTIPEPDRAVSAVEDLQTLLSRLGRRIAFALDATASHAEHTVTHERPRFAFFQMMRPQSDGHREAPRFDVIAPGVASHEHEVVLGTDAHPRSDPELPLRVATAAAEFGLPINPVTLMNLRACPIRDDAWNADARDMFVRLLASGRSLIRTWEEIDYAGIPGRWIPEWLGVRNRPSASAAHRYTIDRHMVEVTSRLGREGPDGVRYDDAHYAALLLAGILHDIGKRPGVRDHASEGARHAPVILRRMGFPQEIVDMTTMLVREHLTLSEFATGRDPADYGVARELSDRLGGDPLILDMLYDLTRADGSSLGATSGEVISKQYGWSRWRETTVRMMYTAVRDVMVGTWAQDASRPGFVP
ncbi:protein-PII uridylyltransferase [Bifidobacterium minimum]|uniref:Protein-PII uridylyltransferase n=2 Tax=Bifidobacterium minimum TaxID=1693 RepID=A0A087BR91_9BIFI|nr:protein-PII uridylyltransferase [Bifidobacterium minimum]